MSLGGHGDSRKRFWRPLGPGEPLRVCVLNCTKEREGRTVLESFDNGEKMKIELDCDKGILKYWKNGKDLTEKLKDGPVEIPKGEFYVPSITSCSNNESKLTHIEFVWE